MGLSEKTLKTEVVKIKPPINIEEKLIQNNIIINRLDYAINRIGNDNTKAKNVVENNHLIKILKGQESGFSKLDITNLTDENLILNDGTVEIVVPPNQTITLNGWNLNLEELKDLTKQLNIQTSVVLSYEDGFIQITLKDEI